MRAMSTPRKALLAAFALLALFFFLRSSTSPSPPSHLTSTSAQPNSADAPPRPYPPPLTQKKPPLAPTEDVEPKTLRERLRFHFPYDLESKFPAYIWQTWKSSPGYGDFEESLRPMEASWSEKHPGFVHEVVTDDVAVHLIMYLYSGIPEIIEAYKAMPVPVMKADFFRYLILLARGGIYSDIDTEALKSAVEWLPEDFDRSTVGLIVGIEADPDRVDWAEWYSRRIQFCQWTIQSKVGHPVLRDIVATITEDTLSMKKANRLQMGRMPPKSIMEFTGPGVWTDALISYFNNKEFFDYSQRSTNISWQDFTGMTEHKKVGDVIVLPITSFSPGVQQMGAGELDHPMAFVKHDFAGSWKPAEERMGH